MLKVVISFSHAHAIFSLAHGLHVWCLSKLPDVLLANLTHAVAYLHQMCIVQANCQNFVQCSGFVCWSIMFTEFFLYLLAAESDSSYALLRSLPIFSSPPSQSAPIDPYNDVFTAPLHIFILISPFLRLPISLLSHLLHFPLSCSFYFLLVSPSHTLWQECLSMHSVTNIQSLIHCLIITLQHNHLFHWLCTAFPTLSFSLSLSLSLYISLLYLIQLLLWSRAFNTPILVSSNPSSCSVFPLHVPSFQSLPLYLFLLESSFHIPPYLKYWCSNSRGNLVCSRDTCCGAIFNTR